MSTETLERFHRDGFVLLERAMSSVDVAELTDALAPFERDRPMGRNDFEGKRSQRVYSLAGKGDVNLTRGIFDKVCSNCKLRKFEVVR